MKFNITKAWKGKTTNYEGAQAFTMNAEMELYSAVVTASLSNQFYEKETAKLERIRTLVAKNKPEFVAKMAVYTREKMYMRSIPSVMAVEMAKQLSGNAIVSKTVNRVVQRADEITELLAYYALANGRKEQKQLNKLSKQVQKGLAMAFNKFDEYQFAKYNREAAVKLKDALFLVHPKSKDEAQQVLFNKIVKDELAVPYTWETELSALGQQKFASDQEKKAAVKAKWEELIESKKLGYMAMLRNLRNMLEAEISAVHVVKVCDYLSNEQVVRNAKQLPFRFLAAYRELKTVKSGFVPLIMEALEDAVKASIENMRGFDEKTRLLIACDVSGSMQHAISAKSKIMNFDIGLILGMMLQSKCKNVMTGMFGDTWKLIGMPAKNILSNVDEFYKREGEVGYSTNGYLVLEDLIKRKQVIDKIMMFTDCQLWSSSAMGNTMAAKWKQYKQIAPDARLYLFDLAGYGNTPLQIKDDGVYLIAGWSDKIFDVLNAIEEGKNTLAEIEKIEL